MPLLDPRYDFSDYFFCSPTEDFSDVHICVMKLICFFRQGVFSADFESPNNTRVEVISLKSESDVSNTLVLKHSHMQQFCFNCSKS